MVVVKDDENNLDVATESQETVRVWGGEEGGGEFQRPQSPRMVSTASLNTRVLATPFSTLSYTDTRFHAAGASVFLAW